MLTTSTRLSRWHFLCCFTSSFIFPRSQLWVIVRLYVNELWRRCTLHSRYKYPSNININNSTYLRSIAQQTSARKSKTNICRINTWLSLVIKLLRSIVSNSISKVWQKCNNIHYNRSYNIRYYLFFTKDKNLSYDIVRKRVFANDTYDYLEFPVSIFCITIMSLHKCFEYEKK